MNALKLGTLALLFAAALTTVAHAAEVVIDTFTKTQSSSGVVDDAGILGGERDAIVNGGNTLNISGGFAQFSLPIDQTGAHIILDWDGNDDTTNVGYSLNADLTGGGSNDRIYLGISSVSGTVVCRVWVESSGAIGVFEFNIDHTGIYELPFNTLNVSDPAPDLTNLERIQLRMVMEPGESVTVNRFSAGNPVLFENGFEPE